MLTRELELAIALAPDLELATSELVVAVGQAVLLRDGLDDEVPAVASLARRVPTSNDADDFVYRFRDTIA